MKWMDFEDFPRAFAWEVRERWPDCEEDFLAAIVKTIVARKWGVIRAQKGFVIAWHNTRSGKKVGFKVFNIQDHHSSWEVGDHQEFCWWLADRLGSNRYMRFEAALEWRKLWAAGFSAAGFLLVSQYRSVLYVHPLGIAVLEGWEDCCLLFKNGMMCRLPSDFNWEEEVEFATRHDAVDRALRAVGHPGITRETTSKELQAWAEEEVRWAKCMKS